MRWVVLLCCAAWILGGAAAPAVCQSTLIVAPTAKTTGAGRFSLSYLSRGQGFGMTGQDRTARLRLGIGPRIELDTNLDLREGTSTGWFWNGKYNFLTSADGDTLVAVGFRSLGPHTSSSQYLALTHKIAPVQLHAGIRFTPDESSTFAGADVLIGKVRVMADYEDVRAGRAGLGAEIYPSEHLSMKGGVILERNDRTRFTIEIKYNGRYD